MRGASLDAPLRVLLLSKTRVPRNSGAWRRASAPWALGAWSLKRYVETLDDLSPRVDISVRSYASDETNELVLQEIVQHRPDIIGFTNQPWNYGDHIRLSRLIRRLFPDIVVVHGGPMVMYRERYLERLGADCVSVIVEGEAEESFAELLAHYADGKPALESIAGIGWFDDEGTSHVTAERANPDVADLPRVMTPEALDSMGSYILYETSRGCPFRCSFCNWGSQKAKLRSRRREVIEADIAAILARPDVTHLWITDSGLDISKDHVLFLADVIKRHKRYPIHISGYFFLLHADLSYVAELRGAFDTLQLGLQTANENVLSELGRKALSIERFDRILDSALPYFPDIRVDLIYGMPGIGPEELKRSVRFLLGKGISLINLYRLIAIPGTEMAENRERYGLVADDEFPYNVYASDGCSTEDLFAMQQFKVNMDTLRDLFGRESYERALDQGIDLVDFADRLHTLVPRMNHLVEYDLEMDRSIDRDLLAALHQAADAYAPDDSARKVLRSLLDEAFASGAHRGDPSGATSVVTQLREPPPAPAVAHDAPSSALRGLTPALATALGSFTEPRAIDELLPRWATFLTRSPHLDQLGMHVHIPFCWRICTFCDCSTEALSDADQLERYLGYLEEEVDHVSPAFAGHQLERLYIGGGTANILSAPQLERMLGIVFGRHRFRDDAVLCLENDPRDSTLEKLRIARSHGINRASFGVQSIDAGVLKHINRVNQTQAMVEQSVEHALAVGIREVNIDFVYGLWGETMETMAEGVAWGLGLAPTTICIQLLNDSHFASPYRDLEHRTRVAREFGTLGERLDDLVAGHSRDYVLHRRPDTYIIVRRDMWRPWDGHLEYYSARDRTARSTVGYGRHAQSLLFGELIYQNQNRTARFDPKAQVYATRERNYATECVADIVYALEYSREVDEAELKKRYGAATLSGLEPVLSALADAGHIGRKRGAIVDEGISPDAVTWLVGQATPASTRATAAAGPEPEGEQLELVRVTEPDCSWSIRIENALPDVKYFKVSSGYGLYYQADPGSEVDAARAATIMNAVAQYVERLTARGVAPLDIPGHVAAFIEKRAGRVGIRAKTVAPRTRRHRLTVVAPG